MHSSPAGHKPQPAERSGPSSQARVPAGSRAGASGRRGVSVPMRPTNHVPPRRPEEEPRDRSTGCAGPGRAGGAGSRRGWAPAATGAGGRDRSLPRGSAPGAEATAAALPSEALPCGRPRYLSCPPPRTRTSSRSPPPLSCCPRSPRSPPPSHRGCSPSSPGNGPASSPPPPPSPGTALPAAAPPLPPAPPLRCAPPRLSPPAQPTPPGAVRALPLAEPRRHVALARARGILGLVVRRERRGGRRRRGSAAVGGARRGARASRAPFPVPGHSRDCSPLRSSIAVRRS